MRQQLTVIFDGEVLRPETPINLLPNARYKITIESENEPENQDKSLEQIIEAMQEEAKSNGLTEEILETILNE